MITLAEVISFLRPNAEWVLDGNKYEGLLWRDRIQTKPTKEEVDEAYIVVSAKKTLDLLKKVKLNELENNYTSAQFVKVIYTTTFLIPIIGEFFSIVVSNQVLEAQVSGAAHLLAKDIKGDEYIIKDIPFLDWKSFYKKSKSIAFSNFEIKNNLLKQIASAKTEIEVASIITNIFPEIRTIDPKFDNIETVPL